MQFCIYISTNTEKMQEGGKMDEEYYKKEIKELRNIITETERRMQDEIDMRDEEIADLRAEIKELNNRYQEAYKEWKH